MGRQTFARESSPGKRERQTETAATAATDTSRIGSRQRATRPMAYSLQVKAKLSHAFRYSACLCFLRPTPQLRTMTMSSDRNQGIRQNIG